MIPLEVVLTLLDRLRAQGIALLETPVGRDAFAYGDACGWMRAVETMRIDLTNTVETANRSERKASSDEISGQNEFDRDEEDTYSI